jgi:hypothetical protein
MENSHPLRVQVNKNVWYDQYPDSSQKWFAIDPDTREVIEIDPEQAYFWTEAWQASEREVDEHLAAGRVKTFDTMDEFLADLDSDNE